MNEITVYFKNKREDEKEMIKKKKVKIQKNNNKWIDIFKDSPLFYESNSSLYLQEKYRLIDISTFQYLVTPILQFFRRKYLNNKFKWYNSYIPSFKTDNNFIERKIIYQKDDKIPSIICIGDIHSSFDSLGSIISHLIHEKFIYENKNREIKCYPNTYIICTGDFVDRGPYGIEVITFLFLLLFWNPENVFLLNGNHEDFIINSRYGLGEEIQNQFPESEKCIIQHLFYYLPSVLFVEYDNCRIQFNHGSISTEEITGYNNNTKTYTSKKSSLYSFLHSDSLYLNYPYNSRTTYKWGEFKSKYIIGSYKKTNKSNLRQEFSDKIVKEYCKFFNIDIIVSGHQDTFNLGVMPRKKKFSNKNKLEESQKLFVYGKSKDTPEYKPAHYLTFEKKEIYALTLSTCTRTKNLPYDSFCILSE